MQKILTLLLLINCSYIFAQKHTIIALEDEKATDGLPYYLADAKTKLPINKERYYMIDIDDNCIKVWADKYKIGLCNKEGKCIVPPIHKNITQVETSDTKLKEHFFIITDSFSQFVVDASGMKIGGDYTYIEPYCGGHILLDVGCNDPRRIGQYVTKYGFLNLETKKELLACQFDG